MKIRDILKATVLTMTVVSFDCSFSPVSYASDEEEEDVGGGGGEGGTEIQKLPLVDLLVMRGADKGVFEEQVFEDGTEFTLPNTKWTFSFRVDPKEAKKKNYDDLSVYNTTRFVLAEFEKKLYQNLLPEDLSKPITPETDYKKFLKREYILQEKISAPFEKIQYKLNIPMYDKGVLTLSLLSEKNEEKTSFSRELNSLGEFFFYVENWMQSAFMYKVANEIYKEAKKRNQNIGERMYR